MNNLGSHKMKHDVVSLGPMCSSKKIGAYDITWFKD